MRAIDEGRSWNQAMGLLGCGVCFKAGPLGMYGGHRAAADGTGLLRASDHHRTDGTGHAVPARLEGGCGRLVQADDTCIIVLLTSATFLLAG